MNNNLLLILFNTIIIYISFIYKKNITYYYIIIFVLLITYFIYLKSKVIEGNIQEDLFRSFNEYESNIPKTELPLKKISTILELMLEKLTGDKTVKDKCEGEFVINKLTNKECGDGFNERIYKITKEGEDCLHSDLYKEKVPLRFCRYNEKCDKDLDCINNSCVNNLCSSELSCSKDMLSSCNFNSCLELNQGLDNPLYYFDDNECKVNPCNENTYTLCSEGGCNNLSYKYKYNTGRSICEKVVEDTDEDAPLALLVDNNAMSLYRMNEILRQKDHDGSKSSSQAYANRTS